MYISYVLCAHVILLEVVFSTSPGILKRKRKTTLLAFKLLDMLAIKFSVVLEKPQLVCIFFIIFSRLKRDVFLFTFGVNAT